MTVARLLTRLLALSAVWAGVELLERVAYAAGVDDAAATLLAALDEDLDDLDDVDDLADVAPFDLTDVIPGPWQEAAPA